MTIEKLHIITSVLFIFIGGLSFGLIIWQAKVNARFETHQKLIEAAFSRAFQNGINVETLWKKAFPQHTPSEASPDDKIGRQELPE